MAKRQESDPAVSCSRWGGWTVGGIARRRGSMPVLPAAPVSLLLALTLGCGGDELGGTLADIEDIYARAQPLLEQQVAESSTTAEAAAAAAEAAQPAVAAAELAYRRAPGSRMRRTPRAVDLEKRRLYEVRQEANQEAHSARLASIAATNWGNTAQQALDNNEEMLQRLRTAYEDDTWDLLTGGMVSPRSVLMDAKRRAETQLMRLEAGCAPSPVWGADDDCEGLGSTDSERQ